MVDHTQPARHHNAQRTAVLSVPGLLAVILLLPILSYGVVAQIGRINQMMIPDQFSTASRLAEVRSKLLAEQAEIERISLDLSKIQDIEAETRLAERKKKFLQQQLEFAKLRQEAGVEQSPDDQLAANSITPDLNKYPEQVASSYSATRESIRLKREQALAREMTLLADAREAEQIRRQLLARRKSTSAEPATVSKATQGLETNKVAATSETAQPDSNPLNDRSQGLTQFIKDTRLELARLQREAIDARSAADQTRIRNAQIALSTQLKQQMTLAEVDIFTAIELGDAGIVDQLLVAGISPNLQNTENESLLSRAAWLGKLEVAQRLIDAGAEVNGLDSRGRTPLLNASISGNLSMVGMLVTHGADIDHKSSNGKTALMAAAWNNHHNIVEYLLTSKADPNLKDNNGRSALFYAIWDKREKTANLLLKHGANADMKYNDDQSLAALAKSRGVTLSL